MATLRESSGVNREAVALLRCASPAAAADDAPQLRVLIGSLGLSNFLLIPRAITSCVTSVESLMTR